MTETKIVEELALQPSVLVEIIIDYLRPEAKFLRQQEIEYDPYIALSKDELFVANEKDKSIQVFNVDDGQLLRSWPEQLFCMGITVSRGEVFVCSPEKIRVYSREGKYRRELEKFGILSAVVSREEIYTTNIDDHVYVLSRTDGKILRQWKISAVCFVTAISKDRFFLRLGEEFRVYTRDGKYLSSWEKKFPRGFRFTLSGGEIFLISEESNQVQVYTHEGVLLRQFGYPETSSMNRIAISKEKRCCH